MEQILDQIKSFKEEIGGIEILNPQQLEEYRIKYLGTKGIVKALFAEMRNVPVDKKKEFGLILNEFKEYAESKYEVAKANAGATSEKPKDDIDLSLPGDPVEIGSRHPVVMVRNRIVNIFQRLGFSVADGPEIEDDWHNFTALNLPENHPARDM
ncbi:MAG: phenylalanine--tRNA ligase subunit alpha, partial [Flavisolibacter sp.]|nr:phenylalanine--tRNA ligase subunit alpha [Flavisolibacter sp.]